MSLADDIREAITIAREETIDLQPMVEHWAWTGQKSDGEASYDISMRRAIVEYKQQEVKAMTGELAMAKAYVGFLEEIKPNGAADRDEPIDTRDVIILPNGKTGPILAIDGFVDAGTGVPFYSQVYLG